jgi:phospholipid/cholesterol/gamma-HCH transport system substrate-binding protein
VSELNIALIKINKGQGTAGKLMNDDAVYSQLQSTIKSVNTLVDDIKVHPKRYVNISVFGKRDKSAPLNKPIADTTSHE